MTCGLANLPDARAPLRPCAASRAPTGRRPACLTTLVLPLEQLGQVDFRRAEVDAVRAHLADFVDDLGGMQQRLGGNAAHVEADAAQHGPAFDQRDLEAEIGGAERGGVATGPGAQHQQLRLAIVRHVGLERLRRLRRGRRRRAALRRGGAAPAPAPSRQARRLARRRGASRAPRPRRLCLRCARSIRPCRSCRPSAPALR